MKNTIERRKTDLLDFAYESHGKHYWLASWYAEALSYKSLRTFKPVLLRAKKLCAQLDLDIESNFSAIKTEDGNDIQLSQFACFLIALKADSRKPMVLRARNYFLHELQYLDGVLKDEQMLERIIGKEEMKSLQKQLNRVATIADVKDYSYFMNAGYLGMYRNSVKDLKALRMLEEKDQLNDHIGTAEMASNIFRISMTTERLKQLEHPTKLETAHEHWRIGTQIRALVKENTGKYPEELDLKADLKELGKALKQAQKQLNTNTKAISSSK